MKNVEIPEWLKGLPMAPKFRPTDTEFADPIAYISKIEKEASAFGMCKIIPPFPKPSKKYVFHNLNKSLSKSPELGSNVNLDSSGEICDRNANDWKSRAVFTTRHQQLGCEKGKKVKGGVPNRVLGAKQQVWESGEVYTLDQFEAKSKNFARSQLGTLKEVNPLAIEAMFWKAASEKPIYVEYANDVPGSGFSEPEGLLHYFHKRRRRRKRNSFDPKNVSRTDRDSTSQNNLNFSLEIAENPLPSAQSYQSALFSAPKDSNFSDEMEGTAGWKLSNSPWNLQVIARSPGSLTRFMPDDIPGVTSPMVYIGMLFSWFAWHVEDHELHSLNFLHIGSPKTWYAVPGDNAFNFEETACLHAYGETTDRLAALSRLGEKTTVFSPEVFAASGIPCCRLVQNPGEFVVTFPRAYHIGFSHGFNCGEAANFGTPKWLSIAKEAAVRRSAMNFLPMLSHQQLLYLLTMSFISRIPRSLLPGVRSSRLRDRHKEERELSVKRAFIDDILHENHLLTVLLQRSSLYHAVFWDAESLPSSSKETELREDLDAVKSAPKEKDYIENDGITDDVTQLNKYIGSFGFDLNDDDLAYDFKMDSGTLPCVVCGVLGFPFMAVAQPSEAASKNHLEGSIEGKAELDEKDSGPLNGESSFSESSQSQSPMPDNFLSNYEAGFQNVEIAKGWNISSLFLKPRLFCLEHAIQIEEMLSRKGGANILVICHSDFQKIKTHAAVVAEEIATPFSYKEISLGDASQEDLNLVDIAIDSEEKVDRTNWSSQLSINLQYCVKIKKTSPAKKVPYLITLGGLFSDKTSHSNGPSRIQWLSRKLRSKSHIKHKPSIVIKRSEEHFKVQIVHEMSKKEIKIIQYSRKKYNSCFSVGKTDEDINMSSCIQVGDNGSSSSAAPSSLASDEKSELQLERCDSENLGSPSYENGIGDTADIVNTTKDQKIVENDPAMLCSVQSDGDDLTIEASESTVAESERIGMTGSKRKRDVDQLHIGGFIKSPCEGLRPRATKLISTNGGTDNKNQTESTLTMKKSRKTSSHHSVPSKDNKKGYKKGDYKCAVNNCVMSFMSKGDLVLHKRNQCTVKGCGKKFTSHKYAIKHHRVHVNHRPLKCPWKGCTMSFKWAWARTEHLRVHTGEKPYACKVEGYGRNFRFVSDFSRHKRKTGYYVE